MTTKNKKNLLSKEIIDELKGFEDVFEDYIEDESKKENERKNKEIIKDLENYELQRFLELENDRLSSLENFFTKKIPTKVNFSQDEKLLQIQKDKTEKLRSELIEDMMDFDSSIMKNLASLFNSHFS